MYRVYLSRRCFYLTQIPQISQRALAPLVLAIRDIPHSSPGAGEVPPQAGKGYVKTDFVPRISRITCIFLADSFYLTRIPQISQNALASLVRPLGIFRNVPTNM